MNTASSKQRSMGTAPKSMPNISASNLLIVCIERVHFGRKDKSAEATATNGRACVRQQKNAQTALSAQAGSLAASVSLLRISLSLELVFAA